MKRLLEIGVCVALILCAGCTSFIEKQVVKQYPKYEKKVVKKVDEILQSMIDNGTITHEESIALRVPLFKILVVLRDDAREEMFGKRYEVK